MARRRSFVRGAAAISRSRETLWLFDTTVEVTLAGAPTAVLALSLNAAALALRPFTVIRTRGFMHCQSDQAALPETFGVGLGMAVVSDQAAAIGVTAVPTPVTDKGSDLWYVYESLFGATIGDAFVGNMANRGVQKEIDSKAMRKVNDDQDLIVVVENEIAGCVVTYTGRFLVKLH